MSAKARDAPDAPAPRPPLLHRLSTAQLQAADLGAAALLALVAILHVARVEPGAGGVGRAVLTGVVWLAAAASIATRRRRPLAAFAVMGLSLVVGLGGFGTLGTGGVTAPSLLACVPTYQLAAMRPRRVSLVALGCEVLLLVAAALATARGHSPSSAGVVIAVAAWFVGDSVRVRRLYIAGLAEQAEQRQRETVERAQRSVAEERLQIARELHDVVAHSLSVIAVQSGVGRHVIDTDPAAAKQALAAVEQTSRSALDELRRMLGVLRHDGRRRAALAPAPGTAGIPALVDQVRATGVPVELTLEPSDASPLSPSADLCVYRIVQEALTNVVKHAGPARARVALREERGSLVVEVLDDGRGATAIPQPGGAVTGRHGLVGMRERVALFGGDFSASALVGGGFEVRASLPLDKVRAP